MTLITLKIFDDNIQAHLLKSKLESEGIRCYLFDENTIAVQPWASLAFGGIKLKIDEADFEKAVEIFNNMPEE